MAQKAKNTSLTSGILGVSRAHFLLVLVFAASIVIYDASQLIAPEAVLLRWKMAVTLLIITTLVWYLARRKDSRSFHMTLVGVLIATDILFTSFFIYHDRGMASLGVALYAIPIATSALLLSRSALLATATLCTAAYALTCVKYFVDFFNEGYRVQLYSSIGFYSACFFILALILITIAKELRGSK